MRSDARDTALAPDSGEEVLTAPGFKRPKKFNNKIKQREK